MSLGGGLEILENASSGEIRMKLGGKNKRTESALFAGAGGGGNGSEKLEKTRYL